MVEALAAAWPRLHNAVQLRLPSIAGGRLSRFCRPASIIFLLTERCNARCLHCDIWKNTGRENTPSIEEWKQALRDLREWLGPVGLAFSGGEMFLYPHALDLVQYAVALGFRLETLTNGYLGDQAGAEKLALANPWRITLSLDGIGAVHSKIRGRDDFYERTIQTLHTLLRMRAERRLKYRIQLKTVVMEHNLNDLRDVARLATSEGVDVLYQPIEQNYNTPYDPFWFQTSANWPRDPSNAVSKIEELIQLKRAGERIANSEAHLTAMIRYFRDPGGLGMTTRAHLYGPKPNCAALTTLQFQANGDVTVCSNRPPIGNIQQSPIRELWKQRSKVWIDGCCLIAGRAQAPPTGGSRADTPPSRV